MEYTQEQKSIINEQADKIKQGFINEVFRLAKTGAIDPEAISLGLIFKVSIDNIADTWGIVNHKEYKNLRKF